MTALDGTPVIHDSIGNPLNDGTWTYTWQHGKQLASMSKAEETITFEYNEDGLRAKKTATSTGVTEYTLHGKNIVHLKNGTANGLNPETYLNHLLDVLPERFANDPQAQLDDLMPWCEEIRNRFRG